MGRKSVYVAALRWALAVLAMAGCLSIAFPVGSVSTPLLSSVGARPSPPVQFSNITRAAGIDFVHFKGSLEVSTILEETGPGVCVADYDGDGFQDIYFVNGRDRINAASRRATRFTTTTATVHSPTSPRRPACPAPVTAWAGMWTIRIRFACTAPSAP